MINVASVEAVNASRWAKDAVKPLYDSYCFAQLPRLITSLFPGMPADDTTGRLLGPLAGTYDRVIVVLVDAFGWRFLEQYQERYPFLRRFEREGVVTKLTSQFPSTTAAHITTIHTGLSVGQSGVYEWFYYEPLVDDVMAPLLFSFAGDKDRETLHATGISASQLFPASTLYPTLQAHGVTPYVVSPKEHTPSPYSLAVTGGARLVPYDTFADGLTTLLELHRGSTDPLYTFIYMGSIDTAGHKFGPGSPHFAAEVEYCFTVLEYIFHQLAKGKLHNTLLLLTADHGQIEGDAAKTIFLNRLLPDCTRWIKTNRQGKSLVPTGSCRDMFLSIRPELLDAAWDALNDVLRPYADVHRVADLTSNGFFGSAPPSKLLLDRIGNLVILPHPHETVWWYEEGRFNQSYFGLHGGCSAQEMETPLLALRYD